MTDPFLTFTAVWHVVYARLAEQLPHRVDRRRPRCRLDRARALVCGCGGQRGGRRGDHLEPGPHHGEHARAVPIGAVAASRSVRTPDGTSALGAIPIAHGTVRARTGRVRMSGDSGAATSLSIALLTPLFVVLAFAAVQAAMWSHAKTEARVIARDTAALIARSGVAAGDAQASASTILAADTSLSDVDVGVTTANGIAVVTVSASAPGIIRGTSSEFEVTAAVPIEELTAP